MSLCQHQRVCVSVNWCVFLPVNWRVFVSASTGVCVLCVQLSVNWCVGDLALEVVNPMTGRTEQDSTSRVSKQSLFQLHSQLTRRLSSQAPPAPAPAPASPPKLYVEAKTQFAEYQTAKEELFKTFHRTGLGSWVKMPAEIDQFEADDPAA